jgi:hypothetical protein
VKKHVTYLSLGAGVQSTALLAMSALGLRGCPKADVAIFADTGDEPQYVYDHLKILRRWSGEQGIPVEVTSAGHLSQDVLDRHSGARSRSAAIPAFTRSEDGGRGMLRRQCTAEYKIAPIERAVRAALGYAKGQRIAGRSTATALIGISLDEAVRMKPSRTPWVTNAYPLVDARMRRSDCLDLIREVGLPEPQKSACRFCPFHDDTYWMWLKSNHPVEFAKAAEFDARVRDMSRSGVTRPVFIHPSLIPLAEVDFDARLADAARQQSFDWKYQNFGNECEGMCGV